jgi:hypothetical protein
MGKFEPGQSGNPGGRVKSKELRDLLRNNVGAAARRLIELVDHKNPRVALLAVQTLFDRVYGKAMQASELIIEDRREEMMEASYRQLTPAEVAVSLKEILTTAEKEMGIDVDLKLSNRERVERILQQPGAMSPALYAALHSAGGTAH